jgi:GNAT superfamily N-acetyltransferase
MANEKQADIIIRFAEERDLSASVIDHLANLINRVYDEAESGMWKRAGTRISSEEVAERLQSASMILAEIEGSIVGAVSIRRIDSHIGEFGALVTDPAYRGRGIGSKLVAAAEAWAKSRALSQMRLELLAPRNWVHPGKQLLERWYSRIGYVQTTQEPFEKMHPDKAGLLAIPCIFGIWHKEL